VREGVRKWGGYFARKGWVDAPVGEVRDGDGTEGDVRVLEGKGEGWRWVLEVATAWAVVKALLPLRIVGCVWAAPWFARVAVLPVTRVFGRLRR